MQSFRQKWTLHQNYKRVQRLWEDYKKVSNEAYASFLLLVLTKYGSDLEVVVAKLSAFLDSFQQAYAEWTGMNLSRDFSLDKIYGDCTDVLMHIFDVLER